MVFISLTRLRRLVCINEEGERLMRGTAMAPAWRRGGVGRKIHAEEIRAETGDTEGVKGVPVKLTGQEFSRRGDPARLGSRRVEGIWRLRITGR